METIRVRKLNHANLHIDCSSSAAQELAEFFSFYVPGFKFMPAYKRKVWDGKIRLFTKQTGELPAGLIHHLVQFCRSHNYIVDPIKTDYGLPYQEDKIDDSTLNNYCNSIGLPFDVRDYQLEGIAHGLKKKRAILLSPTGSGKSLIIYLLVRWILEAQKDNILIIVPTTGLVEQLYGDFRDYGYDVDNLCHKIYSGKDKVTKKRIIISTWQSIYKLPIIWFEHLELYLETNVMVLNQNLL